MKKDKIIYAVTDRAWLHGRKITEVVELAIKGGAELIQLREKELPFELFLEEAKEVASLCKSYHVPLLINDNVEIALLCGADGAHIGQSDIPLSRAREILGANKIIGVSANTVEDALLAEQGGADCIGTGAIFPTSTKDDAEAVSLSTLQEICKAVSIPVYAIGGIKKENIAELQHTDIAGAAIVSAIFAANDIEGATRELKLLLNGGAL